MPDLTQQVVMHWIETATGGEWFTRAELDDGLGIGTEKAKATRRVILSRLLKAEFVTKHPTRLFVYRMPNNLAPVIDWQSADTGQIVPILWPFKLEEWVAIYPKNLIVLAGTFNAGKTAFCLNLIAKNQHRAELSNLLPIEYFSSEMGPEEMKLRLSKFSLSDWAFTARERSTNFAEVIKPNKINIIDYLEVTDNFYLIAQELTAIFNKLDRGVAIITVQKKQGATMGRGAEFSLEKPRLYLTMDTGLLRIVKGKNWAKEGQNPNGKQWKFKLIGGWKFIDIEEA